MTAKYNNNWNSRCADFRRLNFRREDFRCADLRRGNRFQFFDVLILNSQITYESKKLNKKTGSLKKMGTHNFHVFLCLDHKLPLI